MQKPYNPENQTFIDLKVFTHTHTLQGFFLAERAGTYLREQNSKKAKIK
jgi:hypothetical protein